jgi:hypothetical protein
MNACKSYTLGMDVSEPSELNGMELTLAKRIMDAAGQGVIDPQEIRDLALMGLLPKSTLQQIYTAAKFPLPSL